MKYLPAIVLVLALVGGLVAIKASQIGTLARAGEAAKQAGPPPETVGSTTATQQRWEAQLTAVGSVAARKGVTISNDAPGIVTSIGFDSGEQVKSGAVLVRLDTSVEQAQLASALSRLQLAETTLARTRALSRERVTTEAELDTAEATLEGARAEVSTLRAQIGRKVVVAPFSGRLGMRLVNVGQYLAPGSEITTLQSEEEEFVDFQLPQQQLPVVHVGLLVKITATDAGIDTQGTVVAVDPTVDPRTRSFQVRASTKDTEERLRPGMFVNVSVGLGQSNEIVAVPVTSVVYAPYGDSVFVIEDDESSRTGKVARQQFVQLGEARGDFVAIDKGLQGGEPLVAEGAFKLRNGSPITIDNAVDLDPKLHPQPGNR